LKEHHGLELRVAQAVIAMAHNPYREREKQPGNFGDPPRSVFA
jgi:hypothetical protein